jgi:rhodanese-related sulfurtransferase
MYAEEDALPWRVVDAIDCFRSLKEGTCVLLDVRPRKDHDREAIKGSLSAPAANLSGGISDRVITPDLDNMTTRVAKMTDKLRDKTVVVVGDGEPYVRDAIRVLGEVLGGEVVEMRGGQAAWLKYYTPAGKPRPRYVGYGKDNEETFWTASN